MTVEKFGMTPWKALILLLATSPINLLAENNSSTLVTRTIKNLPLRTWTDNTGVHRIQGTLVGVGPSHVRIRKTTGRYTTVPTARLSRADMAYVSQIDQKKNASGIDSKRQLRTWTDDTGQHQVQGWLVSLDARNVRIFKSTGRYTTVPIHRLSYVDASYVYRLLQQDEMETSAGTDHADVVFMRVSREILEEFGRRRFRQSDNVNENILGTPIRGSARTVADMELRFVPNAREAQLQIPVRGIVRSWTTAFSGRVQVHSTGRFNFQKFIQVSLGQDGVDISAGSLLGQNARMITGISTSFRCFLIDAIARRIAMRRSQSGRGRGSEIRRIGEMRTRRRVNGEINERVQQLVSFVNQFTDLAVNAFEKVRDEFPIRTRYRTTDEELAIVLSMPSDQLATLPTTPPDPGKHPFVAQVHTSLVQKAITEREIVERLRPVLDEYLGQQSATAERIKETIISGKYETGWSDDSQWFKVIWYPPENGADGNNREENGDSGTDRTASRLQKQQRGAPRR